MLVFGPKQSLIEDLKRDLSRHVELSDLGPTKFYLGIEIHRDRPTKRLVLSQKRYLNQILDKYNKRGLNPMSSPSEVGVWLAKASTSYIVDLINMENFNNK